MHRSLFLPCLAALLVVGQVSLTGTALGSPVVRIFGAAKNAKKNIAVGRFAGPNSGRARMVLMKALKQSGGYAVTDAEDIKHRSGKRQLAKQAKVLEVDAVVTGTVSRKADLSLSIYSSDGTLIDEVKVKGGSFAKLEKALAANFDETLAEPLAEASGAEAPEKKASDEEASSEPEAEVSAAEIPPDEPPLEPSEDEKPAEDDAGASKAGLAPFELMVGIRGYNRKFSYSGNVGAREPGRLPLRSLVPYELDFAPAVIFSGRIYPLAFFRDDVWSHLGITGSFEVGVATETEVRGDTGIEPLKTSFDAWDIGLRGRLPLGALELGIFGVYGSQSFVLVGDEGGTALQPLVPDVKYQFLRFGLDARVQVSTLRFGAHVAPRVLTSLEQIDLATVWFPGATGRGLDFGFEAGWNFLPYLGLVAGFDYVRYGFDFNAAPPGTVSAPNGGVPPSAEDPLLTPMLAGGATDTYVSGRIGFVITLGGAPKPTTAKPKE
jgi:hypothetical protein